MTVQEAIDMAAAAIAAREASWDGHAYGTTALAELERLAGGLDDAEWFVVSALLRWENDVINHAS